MVYLRALLLAPGVVLHELAHHLFCLLTGVRVRRVVYFRLGNPAGFVVHDEPTLYRQVLAVAAGPFILNSATAVVLFNQALHSAVQAASPAQHLLTVALTGLGLSIALQAFPSRIDAANLITSSNRHLMRGNPLALAGYPLAVVIYAGHVTRPLGSDWFYALLICYVALSGFLRG
jgi:uncharacterized integral membrane protein